VDFWETFGIPFDRQYLPLAAHVQQLQDLVEDFVQRQCGWWAASATAQMWQDTRHTASTLLREHGWTKDHVEAQLSHVEEGVAGDYNQALYLPHRTAMMQWYANYLDALKVGITPAQNRKFEKQVNRRPRS
jgi:hypothetical protein